MSRFAVNCMKRNFRVFALGLTGLNLNLQDVSHKNDLSFTLEDQEREARKQIQKDALAICDDYRVQKNIDGMSVAITINGELLLKQGFGYKDKERLIPADGDMRGDVASLSKLITVHLMMQLHERQEYRFDIFDNLRLETPFLDHDLTVDFKVLDKTTATTTIHQETFPQYHYIYTAWLLSHRSGIRHYRNSPRENDAALPRKFQNSLDALDMFADDNLTQWPGEFLYSSYAYNLAGAIIEQVVGRDFQDHAADELQRLNMRNSFFPRVHKDVIYNYASGYANEKSQSDSDTNVGQSYNCQFVDKAYKYPSGGLVSTVGDLVKFGDIYSAIYQNLLDDEEPDKSPIASDTVKMMWTNHSKSCFYHKIKERKIGSCSRGLGWKIKNVVRKFDDEDHFFTALYHIGLATGFTSFLGTSFVTKQNLARKKMIHYNCPRRPTIPGKFKLINTSCDMNMRLSTANDLSHNGNILHRGEFEGITIAIIGNQANASVEELYWELVELVFRVNSENGYCLINFPEEVGTRLANSYCSQQ